jgi:hypothetical protein
MITPPAKIAATFNKMSQSMPLRIEQANLVGRNVLFHEQRYTSGPVRKIPYSYSPNPFGITVLLSEDYREREFFQAWQDIMLGDSRTSARVGKLAHGNGALTTSPYDVGYYDDAITGASVDMYMYATTPAAQGESPKVGFMNTLTEIGRAAGFDPSTITSPFGLNLGIGKAKERDIDHSLHVHLIEPFPMQINDVPMSWSEDGFARLQVEFSYKHYEEAQNSFGVIKEQNGFANMLRSGIQSFNRFSPVFSLIAGQGLGSAVRAAAEQVGMGARNAGVAQKSLLPF